MEIQILKQEIEKLRIELSIIEKKFEELFYEFISFTDAIKKKN